MKRVLMIAYHFPPLAGSSGIQRTLRFVQHLPKFGWEPLVLSADPRAYERTSDDLLADVPPATVVRRAFALDTARHLSIAGRYVGAMARPDRWVSWKYAAVRDGMRLIREFNPQAICSTYPIASARVRVLENGYDEETFTAAASSSLESKSLHPGAITLLHSGIVYPAERDPTQLFEALGRLKAAGTIQPGTFVIRFRASVHDDLLQSLATRYAVTKFINCQPPVPYRDVLAEM